MHAAGNCRNCGAPIFTKGEKYCSRKCENDDFPAVAAEGCVNLGCTVIVAACLGVFVLLVMAGIIVL